MTEDAPSAPPLVSSTKRIEWSDILQAWDRAEVERTEQNGGSAYFAALRRIGMAYERIGPKKWPEWLAANGVPGTRVKRPFHSLIKHLAASDRNKGDGSSYLTPLSSEIVTSKGWVSRLASALDEWNDVARVNWDWDDGEGYKPVRARDIDSWIGSFNNGVDGVCAYRRNRIYVEKHGEDKPKQEPPVKLSREERERIYHDVLTNPAQPVLPIPEPFGGYNGEYVLAVKLDGATGEMTIRSMWKPDTDFWLRNADKMIGPTPVLPAVIEDRLPPRIEISRQPEPQVFRAGKQCSLSIGCQHGRLCHPGHCWARKHEATMAEASE